ncbi:TRAP transporter substrate-binding protein DctP [Mesorhizobium sp. A556]
MKQNIFFNRFLAPHYFESFTKTNKGEISMNRSWKISALGACLVTGLATFGTAHAEDVTLRMVGAWAPSVSPIAEIGHQFIEVVDRLSEGHIKIQYIGAADVLSPLDQPEALVNGVFDVWYGAPNYWAGIVPGGYITELSMKDIPDGGVDSDLFAFMVKMYAEHGVRYLGHFAGTPGAGSHFLITQKEVTSLEDLSGIKLRVPPLARPFAQAVKAETITLPPSEIFLAVDRGVVDGFTWPISDGFTNYGWQSISKYVINQPMYRSGLGIDMNLSKWDSLTSDQQAIMLKAVTETQEWAKARVGKMQDDQLSKIKEAGMQVIEITDEEKDEWTRIANESLWAYLQGIIPTDKFSEAKRLLSSQ